MASGIHIRTSSFTDKTNDSRRLINLCSGRFPVSPQHGHVYQSWRKLTDYTLHSPGVAVLPDALFADMLPASTLSDRTDFKFKYLTYHMAVGLHHSPDNGEVTLLQRLALAL